MGVQMGGGGGGGVGAYKRKLTENVYHRTLLNPFAPEDFAEKRVLKLV